MDNKSINEDEGTKAAHEYFHQGLLRISRLQKAANALVTIALSKIISEYPKGIDKSDYELIKEALELYNTEREADKKS